MHRVLGLRPVTLLPPLPVSVSLCRTPPPCTSVLVQPPHSPLYLRHTYFCNFCRNTIGIHSLSEKYFHTNGRNQSTQVAAIEKTKKKRKKSRKYVELLEVSKDATSQTKASISQLRAIDLSKLAENPEISLEQLYELKKKNPKLSDPVVDMDLLRDLENKILNNDKNEVHLKEDDCAIIFTSEKFFDLKYFSQEERLKVMKDSYDKFRRETIRVQKLNDLKYAIDGGVNQSITPTYSSNTPEETPTPEVKGPHEIFKECLKELKNKSDTKIVQLDILGPEKKKSKTVKTVANSKIASKKIISKNDMADSQKKAKEDSLARLLVAHFDACISSGMIDKASHLLKHYVNNPKPNVTIVKNTAVFNIIIEGYAAKGDFNQVCDILNLMNEKSIEYDTETFIAIFECIDKSYVDKKKEKLKEYVSTMKSMNITFDDLLDKPYLKLDQRKSILNSIRLIQNDFKPSYKDPKLDYVCPLLSQLNKKTSLNITSPAMGLFDSQELKEKMRKQADNELKGFVELKNIDVSSQPTEYTIFCREIMEKLEKQWRESIHDTFINNLKSLKVHDKVQHVGAHVYPYLNILPPEEYVDIIMGEVKKLAAGSETFTPTTNILQKELGIKVYHKYEMLKKRQNGEVEDVLRMYEEYCDWYLNRPSSEVYENPRKKWQKILHANSDKVCIDSFRHKWPSSICYGIGKVLYNILINNVQVDVNCLKKTSKSKKYMPAFYHVFRNYGYLMKQEIKPHPILARVMRDSMPVKLTMDTSLVPCYSPPLPWINYHHGGYLITKTPIMRVLANGLVQMQKMKDSPQEMLYPVLDSLNQLAATPWKVNQPVLDLMISIFRQGGSKELTIAQSPQTLSMPLPASASLSKKERAIAMRKRAQISRQRQEMYSLWCDLLYKLSLANHYRDDIFWLPHNMDFRGRVYPCPPHLSHLGADTARSLMLFARGEKLGADGLRWLKLHCINLTGTMKRKNIQERLDYVETIMEDILDSADRPLDGRKWWALSETPWQTLACCMEIANAVRSPNPEEYMCHFPIHQDGSCNGLQHYAALGRDSAGAYSVNLSSAEEPQDVYSSVVNLVEERRAQDAANGVQIAQELEGFVKRKVIKQTVMTTVYGVTRFGARLQIAKQLKDMDDFPKNSVWAASSYLTEKTFVSLAQMFTSTREIQDWFTDCAKVISGVCKDKVEWITPLGLPVVQPYYKNMTSKSTPGNNKILEYSKSDLFEKPCVLKQKNAFPPNFIHSLDSSHMMLTSLHCEAQGITFVSVHDCFWTHPSSVAVMNKICREQFVALHSQPILEDLSNFMLNRYINSETKSFELKMINEAHMKNLVALFQSVPKKGDFNLKEVLKSTYFFS